MLLRLLQSFSPRRQPWITRQSYHHELINALTYSVAIAVVEGGVVAMLARKTFNVNPAMFATIMAAPMFANLTSFLWAYLARGRRKVPTINALQVAALLSIGSIALLPTTGYGPLALTVLIVLTRCLISGVVTIRSTVWRMNYPRQVRAQVTGKLALISSMVVAIAPLIGYAVLDINADLFRVIYPLSVLVAFIGVISFARVRLRGEPELLRFELSPIARPQPHGEVGPIYEYDPTQAKSQGRENFWTVLKRDHLFRTYMIWQMVAGGANMAGEVVIIYIIAEFTAGMPIEYFLSIALSTAVPLALATLTLPFWAKQLDRMHIAQFRSRQAWVWILAQGSNWLAALLVLNWTGSIWGPLAFLALGRLLQGVNRGAGMLAWNLGHNDFADRRMVALYMGIHVTLTGIRGAIVPFVGMALYAGWGAVRLPLVDLTLAPAFGGIGPHVFLITTGMAVAAEIGFRRLNRSITAAGKHAVPKD